MAVRDGLLITRDFSSSPGTTWVVDVPSDYTVASITVVNVGLSASGLVRLKLSSGGTVVDLDIRVFVGVTANSSVVDAANGGIAVTDVGTSGLYGNLMLWNMNTLAPVTALFENLNGSYAHRTAMYKSAVAYSQIFIDTNVAATINAGTIYVQLYKRPNTVIVQDFTASPLTNWDITGLTKTSGSAIMFSAYDLTMSSTLLIQGRVSVDGIVFDATGADYRLGWVLDDSDNVALTDTTTMAQTAASTTGLCSLYLGMPLNCKTLFASYDNLVLSGNAVLSMGNREERQVETTLRVFATGAGTINGGKGYAVKYEF